MKVVVNAVGGELVFFTHILKEKIIINVMTISNGFKFGRTVIEVFTFKRHINILAREGNP